MLPLSRRINPFHASLTLTGMSATHVQSTFVVPGFFACHAWLPSDASKENSMLIASGNSQGLALLIMALSPGNLL
jgi:hypothetical protein